MTNDELQQKTLKLLAGRIDARLGRGDHYLAEALKKAFPDEKLGRYQIQELIWSLVSQGLAYIDFWQPAPENWVLCLTEAGKAAASDQPFNPDDPSGFLAALVSSVPGMSDTVQTYAREALHAFNARLYFASAVMLGVASEAAFLELAHAFADALPSKEGKNLRAVLTDQKTNYLTKFTEFRKRLEPRKADLPENLGDGINLWLSAVLDLLRIYRNEAGHPKASRPSREDCFLNLRMFGPYLARMYRLKNRIQADGLRGQAMEQP